MDLKQCARLIIECDHIASRLVVFPQWCATCGALRLDGEWIVPEVIEPLRVALRAQLDAARDIKPGWGSER
jgi:hypothetical protein